MRLIILVLFSLLFSPFTHAIGIPVGGIAPDFTLMAIDGKTVTLKEYKGNILVLVYWETGQDRSLMALDDGKDLFKKYKAKGVRVIGIIAETENVNEVNRILREHEIDFPVLLDPERQVYGDYGIRVYPSTVVIDREGKLAYDLPGHAPIYKMTLEADLQYMLGEIDQGKLKETLSSHREIKDEAALEAERRYNLALNFTETRLFDKAIDAVKKSIEAKADIAKAHILLGFLYLNAKEADKAISHFNKAIELEPLSHDAMTGIGGALILKGELDRAIEILNKAAVANPYPQMTYYELGRAYELKGDKDNALGMYKKAIEQIIHKQILPTSLSRGQ